MNKHRHLFIYINSNNFLFSIGLEVDLRKREKCIDDINDAFDLKNPKWSNEKMVNVKSIMGLFNLQMYHIEKKVQNLNYSKWTSEQVRIPKKLLVTLQIQKKLIDEIKEILRAAGMVLNIVERAKTQ